MDFFGHSEEAIVRWREIQLDPNRTNEGCWPHKPYNPCDSWLTNTLRAAWGESELEKQLRLNTLKELWTKMEGKEVEDAASLRNIPQTPNGTPIDLDPETSQESNRVGTPAPSKIHPIPDSAIRIEGDWDSKDRSPKDITVEFPKDKFLEKYKYFETISKSGTLFELDIEFRASYATALKNLEQSYETLYRVSSEFKPL